jgi:hypothetical protein
MKATEKHLATLGGRGPPGLRTQQLCEKLWTLSWRGVNNTLFGPKAGADRNVPSKLYLGACCMSRRL